jgi:uncharacterized protein (TIGR02996 family)
VTEAPTTTGAALRAAILASPEDDAPRLVYADWLDENGEPERAEFVRVQCELTAMSWVPHHNPTIAGPGGKQPTDPERYGYLRQRERELEKEHWLDWIRPFAGLLGFTQPYTEVFTFRRGFVAELRCPLAAFLGGECPACGGTGDLGTLGGRIGCNVCSDTWSKRGTGRAPGAAAVCRVEPVTKVVLVGCEPYENSSGQWQWYDARRTNQTIHPQSDLPGELWDLLKQPARGVQKDHPTRDDALDALSRACIRWARGQGPA